MGRMLGRKLGRMLETMFGRTLGRTLGRKLDYGPEAEPLLHGLYDTGGAARRLPRLFLYDPGNFLDRIEIAACRGRKHQMSGRTRSRRRTTLCVTPLPS